MHWVGDGAAHNKGRTGGSRFQPDLVASFSAVGAILVHYYIVGIDVAFSNYRPGSRGLDGDIDSVRWELK